VRLVLEQVEQHESEWDTIVSIAGKMGCSAETLRRWLRRYQIDHGERAGVTSEEKARVKELEREVYQLRRANEILRKAAAFFAQAELDRPVKR
jgi:transposase-like protein